MAHEISFSIILRLSDDAIKACEEHERFAAALGTFIGTVGLENAQTHLSMREVRAPRGRNAKRPRLAAVSAPAPDDAA